MMTPFQQGKQFFCDRGPSGLNLYGNPYDFGHPDDLKTKSYQDFEDGFFEAFRIYMWEDWVVEYLQD